MKGVNFYKFSRKEEEIFFCHNLPLQLDSNMSLSESASISPLSAWEVASCVLCIKALPFPLLHIFEV